MTLGDVDAWLVDDRWSKAYALGDETSIGRGAENAIILRDPAVSRRHAFIVKQPTGYVLHATGSSGTSVNGARVGTECVLQEGDVIEIAFSSFRFTMKAPTGEMFVVRQDTPTVIDRQEGPTRVTLRAVSRVEAARSVWRRHWHLILGLLLVIGLLLFATAV